MRKRPEYQFLLQNGRPLKGGSANNVMVRGFKNRTYYKLHRPQNRVTGDSNLGRRLGKREKHVAGNLGPTHLPGGSRNGEARQSSDLDTVSDTVPANRFCRS